MLRGAAKDELSRRILAAYDNPEEAAKHTEEYAYYPRKWASPYIERRRKIGWDLYGLLGIQKGDKAKMHAQHARNYKFFDAPVGFIFTLADVGNDDSIDSDAVVIDPGDGDEVPVTGSTLPITLSLDGDTTWDAGLAPQTVVPHRVWLDEHANGLHDPGQPWVTAV